MTYMPDAPPDGGLIADLCAKLDLHIGSTRRLTEALRPRPPQAPAFMRIAGTRIADSNGVAVIRFNLRGPDQGHMWYVRNLVVGGNTPTTAAAGRADVYVSAGGSPHELNSLAGLGLGDWRDESIALPNVAFYGRGEMPLGINEQLYVVVTGGTAAQQYVAAATAEDFELAPSKQDWSV